MRKIEILMCKNRHHCPDTLVISEPNYILLTVGVITSGLNAACGQIKDPVTKYASIFGYLDHPLNWLIQHGGNEVKECLKK